MLYKKNIQIVLCLFIFLSINGFARPYSNLSTNKAGQESIVFQNTSTLYSETGNEIKGILPSIKLTETNSSSGFQNFKNGKNGFLLLFSFGHSAPSLFLYRSYCVRRTNSFSRTPFYIAFRSLII
ncbi:MAG: hypothetical protein Q7W13_08315 [Bacteroidia bacterium]|nr:hypothetical protein [Bacteroidia bacterium]